MPFVFPLLPSHKCSVFPKGVVASLPSAFTCLQYGCAETYLELHPASLSIKQGINLQALISMPRVSQGGFPLTVPPKSNV